MLKKSHIEELVELGRQSYALANGTLNPDVKKNLQDMGKQYVQEAYERWRPLSYRLKHPH
jgi:hypothetical protein